jgi:hypothetical protein
MASEKRTLAKTCRQHKKISKKFSYNGDGSAHNANVEYHCEKGVDVCSSAPLLYITELEYGPTTIIMVTMSDQEFENFSLVLDFLWHLSSLPL